MTGTLVHHFTTRRPGDARKLYHELSAIGFDAHLDTGSSASRQVDVTARVRVDDEPDPHFAVVLASLFHARYLGVWRYYECDQPDCRCNVLVRGERVWP